MKIYIDSANIEDIQAAQDMGILSGVTTNPSLMAKEGKDIPETLKAIADIVPGPVSGEVSAFSETAEAMVAEGREIAAIHERMVVKIPMTAEGLKAISVLSKEGIATNCTLIFSPSQALLAARAGATYVSPFLGRLDDISTEGLALVADIVEIFDLHGMDTEVIAASIRHPMHVVAAAKAGAHIATLPYKVIQQMIHHPLTDQGITLFQEDYAAVFGRPE